jgi:hypothetical protein
MSILSCSPSLSRAVGAFDGDKDATRTKARSNPIAATTADVLIRRELPAEGNNGVVSAIDFAFSLCSVVRASFTYDCLPIGTPPPPKTEKCRFHGFLNFSQEPQENNTEHRFQ